MPDIEPPFWGAHWVTRFAAHFTKHVTKRDRRAEKITRVVNRVIEMLPDPERRMVIDYYLLCLSRKAIAGRQNLSEREVDAVRVRAERRLRGLLAGFVEERFGLRTTIDSACPYCRAPCRAEIDHELSRRDPGEAWSALRQRINTRFGLTVKRVQTLMTHCRFHGSSAEAYSQPAPKEQSHVGKNSSKR